LTNVKEKSGSVHFMAFLFLITLRLLFLGFFATRLLALPAFERLALRFFVTFLVFLAFVAFFKDLLAGLFDLERDLERERDRDFERDLERDRERERVLDPDLERDRDRVRDRVRDLVRLATATAAGEAARRSLNDLPLLRSDFDFTPRANTTFT